MKNKNSFSRKTGVLALFAFSLVSAQNYEQIVTRYLQNTPEFKTTRPELTGFKIINTDPSESMKGTILHIQQQINGIPIYQSEASSFVKNNEVVYFSDNFQRNFAGDLKTQPSISEQDAFNAALASLGLDNSSKYNRRKGSTNFVEQQLVYYPEDGKLVLAYEINFEEAGSSNLWHVIVDASTSKVLEQTNLLVSCNFHPDAFHSETAQPITSQEKLPNTNPQQSAHRALNSASYKVFALPIEAPTFGDRSLVIDPWDLSASPQGWQSDGTTDYTITRGNNVYAYLDLNGTNTIGASADGGANRIFDFPLDYSQKVETYTDAAITNLFYVNNKMHDIFYKFGFNETAKNFQVNNFGKGGTGNDPVNAEARDGSGFDNANFATPSDGSSPRMQMYLWNPLVVYRLKYNSPAEFVPRKPLTMISTSFGPALTAIGVTGDLAMGTPADGCAAYPANIFTDKIAFIERGTCGFTVKVKNAQDAGAKAVVIYNVDPAAAFGGMGGTDATITIPSVLIKKDEGDLIKEKLVANTTVNITLSDDKSSYIYRDGSLDNGIIAHEYGHGISTRLTGTSVSCLSYTSDNEQMGEGWSDFFALNVTNQPNATAAVPRGVGTFASWEDPTDIGIRPKKYSPDFAVNNYTYGKTNGMYYTNAAGNKQPDVHSIGFIWATMLWDLYWKYVDKYGYNRDLTADMNSGSSRFMQTVLDGIKLQGCLPTFVKGRDAIIQADLNTTGGQNKCMIWETFAKRGLGVNAKPGSISGSPTGVQAAISDQVEDFTVPVGCNSVLSTVEANKYSNTVSIYPNPAKNEFFITAGNSTGKSKVEIYDASGKLVKYFDKVDLARKEAFETTGLSSGVYIVKINSINGETSHKLIIKH